jgi:beta-N-acetylhexosaminidase
VADRAGEHYARTLHPLRSRRLSGGLAVAIMMAATVGVVAQASASRHRDAAVIGDRGADLQGRPALPSPAVAELVDRDLSLAQLAGQRIIYEYSGLTPPAALLAQIRAGEAAGVIFFDTNIASRAQLARVVDELQGANASSPVHAPLLMMTDQEGGEIRRLDGAPVLSEQEIGASPSASSLASAAGTGAGENLRSVGLNVNLAPVADVARAPAGFDGQYKRSYGPNATKDAALVSAFVKAQQGTGVAATAKHFPGLGAAAATQDTDSGPVTLNLSPAALRSIDEVPFQAAIAAGVKLVMVSWAIYPELDPALPAGLSSKVIDGELRSRLGFQGVTITDALTAGALNAFGSIGARGVLAARAGADLLLCTEPTAQGPALTGTSVMQSLEAALRTGQLSRSSDAQAVARVIALRQGL